MAMRIAQYITTLSRKHHISNKKKRIISTMFNNDKKNKELRASNKIKHLKKNKNYETVRNLKKNKKHLKVIFHKGHLTYGLITIIAITIFYLYVDRDASMFFNSVRHTEFYNFFFWMQYLSNILEYAVPLLYLYLFIMLFFKRFYYFEEFIFAATTSLLVAVSLKNFFKHIFGRYWTETFTHNNLSLIKNDAYGFNFFHSGSAFDSFPSGHSAVIFAVMTVLWIMYPRLRWLAVLCCITVIVGLLGCDFHFPSDIIAGAFIGVITAYFVLHASQIFASNLREHKNEMIIKNKDK